MKAGSALCALLFVALLSEQVVAQDTGAPLLLLDVPFVSQSEALCGGAAAAMVLRYWGDRGLTAESFAHLVDGSVAGIRTTALVGELHRRGWGVSALSGTSAEAQRELGRGRPVLALIEDRRGTFHYIVLVGWHQRAVVFHDPARTSFRVMPMPEFERRWEAADHWMLQITPPEGRQGVGGIISPLAASGPGTSGAGDACQQLVSEGARLAQAGDIEGAERSLTSALGCSGPAPLRELAGLRFLQKRWEEAGDLATAALDVDPDDEYSWQLLATSRFLRDERLAALAAWNRIGIPRLDLVRVDGLDRTTSRVVENALDLGAGDLLTTGSFSRARRRLDELPSATATRLEYVPLSSGLAELRAAVTERPLLPHGGLTYLAIATSTAATRELRVTTGSIAGGGEEVFARWRFWPHREAYGVGFRIPAPWRGVWGAEGSRERQGFSRRSLATAERTRARLTVSDWATGWFHWGLDGGVDRWDHIGTFASGGATVRFVTLDDRVSANVSGNLWVGGSRFATGGFSVRGRSASAQRGTVLLAVGGGQLAGRAAPMDIWPAGDTGHARDALSRAHPLLDGGRLEVERLGLSLVNVSLEAQRWRESAGRVRFGGAAFVDAVRTARRVVGRPQGDVDAGVGLRVGALGLRGVFRIDVAKGLRDGATAVSFAYDVE